MIETPVKYNSDDQALVAAFDALGADEQLGSYWSNDGLKDLRSRVKAFYVTAQNARCCYCNRHLGTENHRMWDVEHVASRVKHPRFMFTPINLAASCPDCNINKGEAETLVNATRKTYPTTSASFRIIHPHFDRFEDHIHHIGMVYLPKTGKGKKTIYVCDLMRFAQKFIAWENSAADVSFEKEVDAVFGDEGAVSEAAVDAIMGRLPTK